MTNRSPCQFAEDLLRGNREDTHEATVAAAKRSAIQAARVWLNISNQYWVDVLFYIEVVADEAIAEAEAAYAARDHDPHTGYSYDCGCTSCHANRLAF